MLEKTEKIMEEPKEQQVEDTQESPEEGSIQQLRDEYKKIKAENKEYKQGIMNSALTSMGLEPDKGIGKAVTKLYDGKANVEDIKEFVAKEFGEGDAINAEPATDETIATNVVEAQSRVEQLNKLGIDNEPVEAMQEVVNYIRNPETSVKNTIGAKLAMMDEIKKQNKQ
jgi:hypothetical protein